MKKISKTGRVYYTRPRPRKRPEEPKPDPMPNVSNYYKKLKGEAAMRRLHESSNIGEDEPSTFGEWLAKYAHTPESNYILGKYESYKPKMFSQPIPEKFYLPSKAQQERNSLLQNLARNATEEDKKGFHYGYIPISWLLANLTYNEASMVVQIIDSFETAKLMAYRKPKGIFG